ncbi:trichothecene C-15 hydroxylase [Pyricularia oryzae]|nr:trichothecene C-15 hydroxylase [Pyricularia oryzae]
MFSLFETLRPVNVFNRIGIVGYRVQNRGRIPRRTFGTTPNTISCVFGPGHGGTRAYPPWVCRQAFAGLKKASSNEKGLHPVEMTSWFHWLTFDVVGDLAFGSGPRIAAPSATTIVGHYIREDVGIHAKKLEADLLTNPGQIVVDINTWAVHHDPNSFTLPESFVPEPGLGDGRFMNGRLDAVKAFSTEPRSYIGKNLAYAQIRMVSTRTNIGS